MARLPALTIYNSKPANEITPAKPGTRVSLDWANIDPKAMEMESVSGWVVSIDYRHQDPLADRILLEAKDWRGEVRYMPTLLKNIRLPA